jgi:creatinine amidohydrolase
MKHSGNRCRPGRWALAAALLACLASGPVRAAAPETAFKPSQTERRYEMLYGEELYGLIRERPLAWLPLGILEKHGAHLPWGLDGLKAHLVCLRMSQKMGGVVLPASHLAGVHGDIQGQDQAEFRSFNREVGDFMYKEAPFREFLLETYDGLANIGFKVIVAYTGHYPEAQTRAVRETAEAFTATGAAVVIPFWEPLACGEGDHGGIWETSIFMALDPGAVRLGAARDEKTGQAGYYRGVPVLSGSSVQFGEKALGMVETYLKERIERALEQNR